MAPALRRAEGDLWIIDLDEGAVGSEFKLTLFNKDGTIEWERGRNRAVGKWPEASVGTVRVVFGDTASTTVIRTGMRENSDEQSRRKPEPETPSSARLPIVNPVSQN